MDVGLGRPGARDLGDRNPRFVGPAPVESGMGVRGRVNDCRRGSEWQGLGDDSSHGEVTTEGWIAGRHPAAPVSLRRCRLGGKQMVAGRFHVNQRACRGGWVAKRLTHDREKVDRGRRPWAQDGGPLRRRRFMGTRHAYRADTGAADPSGDRASSARFVTVRQQCGRADGPGSGRLGGQVTGSRGGERRREPPRPRDGPCREIRGGLHLRPTGGLDDGDDDLGMSSAMTGDG